MTRIPFLLEAKETLYEENYSYYDGETFKYWIGPSPNTDTKDGQKIWIEINRVFQSANKIQEVVDRHRRALLGKPPVWFFTNASGQVLKGDATATAADTQLQRLFNRWRDLWTSQRDSRLDPYNKALLDALVCDRGVLRVYSPERYSNHPDPLRRVVVHAPDPRSVEFVRDDNDFIEQIRYTYTTKVDGESINLVEVQYVDESTGLTVFSTETDSGDILVDPETGEGFFTLDLGGRYTIFEITRRSLITDSIKQAQNAINHALTMIPRNIEYSGFLREIILNGQEPGTWEEDPKTGRDRFVVSGEPLQSGANIINYVPGLPIYDATGNMTGYTTPSVVKHDIANLQPIIDAFRAFVAVIYESVGQSHLLGNDLLLSGISRVQQRQDFYLMLTEDASNLGAMLANTWMVALFMINQENIAPIKNLELTVKPQIIISQPLPEEQLQIREDYKEGLLSRASAIASQARVDDIDAEIAQIESETQPVDPTPTPTQPTES